MGEREGKQEVLKQAQRLKWVVIKVQLDKTSRAWLHVLFWWLSPTGIRYSWRKAVFGHLYHMRGWYLHWRLRGLSSWCGSSCVTGYFHGSPHKALDIGCSLVSKNTYRISACWVESPKESTRNVHDALIKFIWKDFRLSTDTRLNRQKKKRLPGHIPYREYQMVFSRRPESPGLYWSLMLPKSNKLQAKVQNPFLLGASSGSSAIKKKLNK